MYRKIRANPIGRSSGSRSTTLASTTLLLLKMLPNSWVKLVNGRWKIAMVNLSSRVLHLLSTHNKFHSTCILYCNFLQVIVNKLKLNQALAASFLHDKVSISTLQEYESKAHKLRCFEGSTLPPPYQPVNNMNVDLARIAEVSLFEESDLLHINQSTMWMWTWQGWLKWACSRSQIFLLLPLLAPLALPQQLAPLVLPQLLQLK